MMADVFRDLSANPAWALMDDRYKKMVREIERLSTDPHVLAEGRAWQNWIAWLYGTLGAIEVTDEMDLVPLYNVILHGFHKVKFETSEDVQRAVRVSVDQLVEVRPEDLEAVTEPS